jgi:hypothetical protein
MRRDKQQGYIVEISASEVSVLLQGIEGEALSACCAIVLVDGQGASIIDSGYCSVTEAKAAWPEAREPGGNHLTPSEADKHAISGLPGSQKLSGWYPEQWVAVPES